MTDNGLSECQYLLNAQAERCRAVLMRPLPTRKSKFRIRNPDEIVNSKMENTLKETSPSLPDYAVKILILDSMVQNIAQGTMEAKRHQLSQSSFNSDIVLASANLSLPSNVVSPISNKSTANSGSKESNGNNQQFNGEHSESDRLRVELDAYRDMITAQTKNVQNMKNELDTLKRKKSVVAGKYLFSLLSINRLIFSFIFCVFTGKPKKKTISIALHGSTQSLVSALTDNFAASMPPTISSGTHLLVDSLDWVQISDEDEDHLSDDDLDNDDDDGGESTSEAVDIPQHSDVSKQNSAQSSEVISSDTISRKPKKVILAPFFSSPGVDEEHTVSGKSSSHSSPVPSYHHRHQRKQRDASPAKAKSPIDWTAVSNRHDFVQQNKNNITVLNHAMKVLSNDEASSSFVKASLRHAILQEAPSLHPVGSPTSSSSATSPSSKHFEQPFESPVETEVVPESNSTEDSHTSTNQLPVFENKVSTASLKQKQKSPVVQATVTNPKKSSPSTTTRSKFVSSKANEPVSKTPLGKIRHHGKIDFILENKIEVKRTSQSVHILRTAASLPPSSFTKPIHPPNGAISPQQSMSNASSPLPTHVVASPDSISPVMHRATLAAIKREISQDTRLKFVQLANASSPSNIHARSSTSSLSTNDLTSLLSAETDAKKVHEVAERAQLMFDARYSPSPPTARRGTHRASRASAPSPIDVDLAPEHIANSFPSPKQSDIAAHNPMRQGEQSLPSDRLPPRPPSFHKLFPSNQELSKGPTQSSSFLENNPDIFTAEVHRSVRRSFCRQSMDANPHSVASPARRSFSLQNQPQDSIGPQEVVPAPLTSYFADIEPLATTVSCDEVDDAEVSPATERRGIAVGNSPVYLPGATGSVDEDDDGVFPLIGVSLTPTRDRMKTEVDSDGNPMEGPPPTRGESVPSLSFAAFEGGNVNNNDGRRTCNDNSNVAVEEYMLPSLQHKSRSIFASWTSSSTEL